MRQRPVTLITGTSKGIGRYLVEYYIKKDHVVIGCSRSESDIENNGYEHFVGDIADEKLCLIMLSAIRKKYYRLDNLINNAGIASMNHSVLTPIDVVQRIFATNFFGTFLFCREAAKLMIKGKYGRIVNFTTVADPLKLEGEAAYASSKAAVTKFTQIMAKEVGKYGITVNAIGPTPVKTDLIKSVPEGKIKKLIDNQSIPRLCEFDDIVNVIDFYIKPESQFITGQVLYLGGI